MVAPSFANETGSLYIKRFRIGPSNCGLSVGHEDPALVREGLTLAEASAFVAGIRWGSSAPDEMDEFYWQCGIGDPLVVIEIP